MEFCAATIEELNLVMGEEFPEFITSFLTDSEQRMTALESFSNSEDYSSLASAAHSFKGSASNLGASALAESCRLVDSAARESDKTAIHKAMVLLRQDWIHARRYYQQLIQ
jgi:HPt (histidine-containing phosphotransfer) domain-containing protein